MEEIWKDIIGYEGKYQISNLGRVKSLNYLRTGKQKLLKCNIFSKFYLSIKLKGKRYSIHRLVAQAFLGLDINNSKIVVCHKDDNPSNNNVENLFLGTQKDNIQDMINKGRGKIFIGNNFSAKKIEVNGIFFSSYTEASKYLGISINGVKKRVKLKWVGYKFL